MRSRQGLLTQTLLAVVLVSGHYVLITSLWTLIDGPLTPPRRPGVAERSLGTSRVHRKLSTQREATAIPLAPKAKIADKIINSEPPPKLTANNSSYSSHRKPVISGVNVKTVNTRDSSDRSRLKGGFRNAPKNNSASTLPSAVRTTARPMNCSGCFQTDFRVVIDQPDVCRAGNDTQLVFLVASAIRHTSQRQAIRATWASGSRNNTGRMRHVFVLGTTADARRMRSVEEEACRFRDVVVLDFVDSYRNLTLKTMASLRWLVATCRHARHWMKVDDDVWVNAPSVLPLVSKAVLSRPASLLGYCPTTHRVNRDPKSKWYIPPHLYPHHTFLPYCVGFAYGGSVWLGERLVGASGDTPFFPLEDVYVGLCLQRLGLAVHSLPGFRNFPGRGSCRRAHNVPTILDAKPRSLHHYWNQDCS